MKEIKGNTYREILAWPTTYRAWPTTYRARLFREIGLTSQISGPTFPRGLRSSWPGFSARIAAEWARPHEPPCRLLSSCISSLVLARLFGHDRFVHLQYLLQALLDRFVHPRWQCAHPQCWPLARLFSGAGMASSVAGITQDPVAGRRPCRRARWAWPRPPSSSPASLFLLYQS